LHGAIAEDSAICNFPLETQVTWYDSTLEFLFSLNRQDHVYCRYQYFTHIQVSNRIMQHNQLYTYELYTLSFSWHNFHIYICTLKFLTDYSCVSIKYMVYWNSSMSAIYLEPQLFNGKGRNKLFLYFKSISICDIICYILFY
jgi:hypothetical protein